MLHIDELFEKYVEWRILALFLRNPTASLHIKEVARRLSISPASVSNAVKGFHADGLLSKEEIGLAHLYKLDNEHPIVRSLKRVDGLVRLFGAGLVSKIIETDDGVISLALYGSFASGEYDEKSDVDLLAISPNDSKRQINAAVREIESRLGAGVSVEVLSLTQWRGLARKNDAFHTRVAENNILLYGSEL
jgi:predicted nucleotidyltransferase